MGTKVTNSQPTTTFLRGYVINRFIKAQLDKSSYLVMSNWATTTVQDWSKKMRTGRISTITVALIFLLIFLVLAGVFLRLAWASHSVGAVVVGVVTGTVSAAMAIMYIANLRWMFRNLHNN